MNTYNFLGESISPNEVVYIGKDGNKLYLDKKGMPVNLYKFALQDFIIHLSDIKRYNGVGISVLEHSYYLGLTLDSLSFNKDLVMCALMHDLGEVITGDLTYASKSRAGNKWLLWQENINLVLWKYFMPQKLHNKYFILMQELKPFDSAFCFIESENQFNEQIDLHNETIHINSFIFHLKKVIKTKVTCINDEYLNLFIKLYESY